MMHGMFETTCHYKGTGVEAAEVPLRGGELSMVFIVPDAGTFDAYVEGLDGAGLGAVLAIADVDHNTVVAIDEKGVEAAAATAVVVYDSGGGIFPDTTFTADRPFLFAIRDHGTDSLLWLGRVLTPS